MADFSSAIKTKWRLAVWILCGVLVGAYVITYVMVGRQLELRKSPQTAPSGDLGLQRLGLHPGGKVRYSSPVKLPLCPEMPPNLRQLQPSIGTPFNEPVFPSTKGNNVQPEERWRAAEKDPDILSHVLLGGTWQPRNCRAREHVAIIVPYRNRPEHLRKFLVHIHQFLQKQQLHYTIFIAEMGPGTTFNAGLMQNIGFMVADKMDDFTCYINNDVDMLPTNENNLYRCNNDSIRHLGTNMSVNGYKKKYDDYLGTATALTRRQYYSVNGFSNMYFGWGYQDDDLRQRLEYMGIPIHHVPMNIGVFVSLPHERDSGNPVPPNRAEQRRSLTKRMHEEGVNSLQIKSFRLEQRPLYTWILAEIDEEQIMAKLKNWS